MPISVFDLFSIGIGPSSSHTVGPMRAARQFLLYIDKLGIFPEVAIIKTDLYGSLALTGKGHCTDIAIMLGLEGETPEGVEPNAVKSRIEDIRHTRHLRLFGKKSVPFEENDHLLFHYDKQLPYHPNAMRFTVYNGAKEELLNRVYYSLGGGFIIDHETAMQGGEGQGESARIPYPFSTASELLYLCKVNKLTIAQIMMQNEKVWRSEDEISKGLLNIWKVMEQSIERGCRQGGTLPGGLNIRRRAKAMYENLSRPKRLKHSLDAMEWVSLWALAVNEENAAAGRIVTAPTNGSAGVIPAVIQYYKHYVEGASDEGIVTFMLTAGAMGILFKKGASISAAEMGCMGEVGVACSMAAAGLTAVMGGSNEQIENAAEIGMEHNLGLTCDPIKGLVQIPCIERNTMGAIKAINAAFLSMQGDGKHYVSLDHVIATMQQTGKDMQSIYKETSLGGLAVNFPEC